MGTSRSPLSPFRSGVVAVGLLAALPATALVRNDPSQRAQRSIEPQLATVRAELLPPREALAPGSAARAFLDRHPGGWTVRIDRRTERPALVQGAGVPWLPASFAGAHADWDDLEPLARAFLEENERWLVPDRGLLELDRERSSVRGDGKLISLYFRWIIDDVPVEGAVVYLRVNSGRVTQFGAPLVGPVSSPTTPLIDAGKASELLLEYSGDAESHEWVEAPRLLLQPEERGKGLVYRLVFTMSYRVPGTIGTWEGRIDARSGEVVGFRDSNRYGRVVGGVYPRTVYDQNEVTVPMPFVETDTDGTLAVADASGAFPYAGGSVTSGLDGPWVRTGCVACTDPWQADVTLGVGIGRLDFGRGGVDAVGNGMSTPAERNTFFHVNQLRRVTEKWLPDLPWLQTQVLSGVNLQDVCNAFYDGTLNFYRSGNGCNNTGEIADVIYHEWGHGLDDNTLLADGATGEGTGDVASMHMTHSPLVGPGFRDTGAPVRNLDPAGPRGLLTTSTIFGKCQMIGVTGPLGFEVHCEGEIYGQASWGLAQALVARHGHHTGWRASEHLFFSSLPDAGGYLPTSALPIYDAYLFVDDDDGNLANGTPHAAEIFAAFDLHGIAGTALPASPHCSRPAQPLLSVTPGCDGFDLSWDAVPGADHYEILRGEVREDQALFPVASVTAPATSYSDSEVAPDTDYFYVVMAVDAGGCESTIESPVPARITRPVLGLVAADPDDSPRGNRSGFADPDEEVDLDVVLANFGSAPATGVQALLTSSAPVSLLNDTASWALVDPGASEPSTDVLRFRADSPQNSCGDVLRFAFQPADTSGCASDPSYFDVELGASGVCDPTPACFTPPTFAGVGSAQPGSSCAEIDLSWQPAESHCINSILGYHIHRDTDPGFTPDATNRIASFLTDTSYLDTPVAPGVSYYYIVRANDSRSGEEENLVRAGVVAPGLPDTRPPTFAGLDGAEFRAECTAITLDWTPAEEACGSPVVYDVYRDTSPFFFPDPQNLVATTTSSNGFVDVGAIPNTNYTYIVQARDTFGNTAVNTVRRSADGGATDRYYVTSDFETGPEDWFLTTPNDADAGYWAWGDPAESFVQPGDCAQGTGCWFTGLAVDDDVDGGSTTLLSDSKWLYNAVDPMIEYTRWFTNDQGTNVGLDPLNVDVTVNDGLTWVRVEQVGSGTPLQWETIRLPFPEGLDPVTSFRIRFIATDGGGDSLVEAGVDDFKVVDPRQGCDAFCHPGPIRVREIFVRREGNDVVLDWSQDLWTSPRYSVYALSGPDFSDTLRIGTSDTKSFVHEGAALLSETFFYRVSSFDPCGDESRLD